MADMERMQHGAASGQSINFQKLTNVAGAAVSLMLVAGIGVWGYGIMVRDVSGVPVVKAAEGPMRIQPEDPGGQQARHQGLAVNDVAAQGTAAKPADRLVLAPTPLDLTLEDQPGTEISATRPAARATTPTEVSPNAEAGERLPANTNDEAARHAAVRLLAEQLSEGVEPLTNSDPAPEAETTTPEVAAVAASGPAIARSLRPRARPANISSVEQAVAQAVAARSTPTIDPTAIPAGTRLAQLGAFESVEVAEREWVRLSGRFDEYLADKTRVIQKAQSGGRTFYRLRAMGFEDLNGARRFCSALVAENAECIPVVTR